MKEKTTEETAPAKSAEEITELVDAPLSEREKAHERAQLCMDEISETLARYNCRIMPRIDPAAIEPVGLTGDKIQVTASYWVAPMPE